MWVSKVIKVIVLYDKGKVINVHAMRAYRKSRGIAPLISNLRTR